LWGGSQHLGRERPVAPDRPTTGTGDDRHRRRPPNLKLQLAAAALSSAYQISLTATIAQTLGQMVVGIGAMDGKAAAVPTLGRFIPLNATGGVWSWKAPSSPRRPESSVHNHRTYSERDGQSALPSRCRERPDAPGAESGPVGRPLRRGGAGDRPHRSRVGRDRLTRCRCSRAAWLGTAGSFPQRRPST
jgi:hypothetical protein